MDVQQKRNVFLFTECPNGCFIFVKSGSCFDFGAGCDVTVIRGQTGKKTCETPQSGGGFTAQKPPCMLVRGETSIRWKVQSGLRTWYEKVHIMSATCSQP